MGDQINVMVDQQTLHYRLYSDVQSQLLCLKTPSLWALTSENYLGDERRFRFDEIRFEYILQILLWELGEKTTEIDELPSQKSLTVSIVIHSFSVNRIFA